MLLLNLTTPTKWVKWNLPCGQVTINIGYPVKFKFQIKQWIIFNIVYPSSVQFSRSVLSDSLRPHESQHTRPPCPLPAPRVYPNYVHWVGDAIQPSHPLYPFSYCPQSFPASESFPVSQLFASGGQSTGVSALASVLPMNTQDWSPLGWTGWISLQSKGLSRVFYSYSESILSHFLSLVVRMPRLHGFVALIMQILREYSYIL